MDHKEIKEEKKENSNQHLIKTKRSLNQSGLEYMKQLKSCMKEKNPAPTPETDEELKYFLQKVSCVCITEVVSPQSGVVAFESLS